MLAFGASLALLLPGAAIIGCGGGEDSELASLVPPDVPLYAEVVLRPEGDQAEAIESFAERVAGIEDPAAAIAAELDSSLADDGVDATFAEDIEPWLGDRGAVFVRSFESLDSPSMDPEAAVLVEVSDADAAQDFIDETLAAESEGEVEESSYGDVDYQLDGDTAVGLIDDFLVFGPEDAFKVAVDASEGESLAESEEYTQPTEASATTSWPRPMSSSGPRSRLRSHRRTSIPAARGCSTRCSPDRSRTRSRSG